MAMTNYLANQIANATLRNTSYTSPANVYVSLYSTAPTISTSGTELVGNGYSRQLSTFNAPSAGSANNTSTITFTCSGNNWPAVVSVGITDASTSGNILYFKNIAPHLLIVGDSLTIDGGNLIISIT